MNSIKFNFIYRIKALIYCLKRVDVLCYLLIWLMVLLVIGTFSQQQNGLHFAQQQYFSSYVFWWANLIPFPGMRLVLLLLFVGLFLKLFTEKWSKGNAGPIVVHIGVLLLLLGGFLTAHFSYEGNMTIVEGGSSHFLSDYYDVELVIVDTVKGRYDTTTAFSQRTLKKGKLLRADSLPFRLRIQKFCQNCRLESGGSSNVRLIQIPTSSSEEKNRAGVTFKVVGTKHFTGNTYTVLEHGSTHPHVKIGEKSYTFQVRRARTYLPFTVSLLRFEKNLYVGTNMAKAYQSDVILKDGNRKMRRLIAMNHPLRYKGYTLYQASYIEGLDRNITILAVVKNYGRIFPYISNLIITLGIILCIFRRCCRRTPQNEKA